jgi:hypothetical protein
MSGFAVRDARNEFTNAWQGALLPARPKASCTQSAGASNALRTQPDQTFCSNDNKITPQGAAPSSDACRALLAGQSSMIHSIIFACSAQRLSVYNKIFCVMADYQHAGQEPSILRISASRHER